MHNIDLDLIFSECENDPCGCGESNLNCIESTCHVAAGCNQCESGYFKLDYNYKCVSCDDAYDDGHCLFCEDFHGCGQCETGHCVHSGGIGGIGIVIFDFIQVVQDFIHQIFTLFQA